MTALARILSEYLSAELSNALGSELGSTLRVFFSGPPKAELDALFLELTQNNGCLNINVGDQSFQINVYLLEQEIEDPKEGKKIFFSIRTLAQFIMENKKDL